MTTFTRRLPSVRARTVLLAALFSASTFFVQATPAEIPLPRPEALTTPTASAYACADEPSFTGHLTSSSGSTTAITKSTSGNVFGYISNVSDDWSCTIGFRYDGLAWSRDDGELDGNFDWGNLINSESVSCNWVIGSTDYLKANSTSDCPDSDAEYAMPIFLANTSTDTEPLQAVFHNDITPDEPGDYGFIHSDCDTYYGGEEISWNQPFGTSNVGNRPGNNCDPTLHESTGTNPDIVVDYEPPQLTFDWPTGVGPALVTSAFAGVQFDVSDNLAGFDATHGWSLQRQTATWSGSACGTFANDGSAVSGTTAVTNTVSSQGLADNKCYKWILSATDVNGNGTSLTSGSIRTDVSGNLGRQPQHTFEDWDLGAGDTLGVNVGTGNLVISHPIVELPIRGSAVELALIYNRHDTTVVGMGPGWRLNVFRRLKINADNTVTFTDEQGARHTFTSPVVNGTVTTYTRPATLYGNLVKDTSVSANEFVLTYRDQSRDKFDISGTEGLLVRERTASATA